MPYEESEIATILKKIHTDLEEIKSFMRLLIRPNEEKRHEILRVLDSDSKRLAYELTDGTHSVRYVAGKVGVSFSTIHHWWREWKRLGLITESKTKRGLLTRKRVFSLEDFGMQISEPPAERNVIPPTLDRQSLRTILIEKDLFKFNAELAHLAERTFGRRVEYIDRKDLVEKIIGTFYENPRRSRLIFIQALKEKAKDAESSFAEYFEIWEKHIKGEL